ncbi:hypothetical protein ACFLX5_00985 [Chloroflexota bacterium]
MVSCNICGKEFKNTQGLRGHNNFVHADHINGRSVAQPATQHILNSNISTPVTVEQRISMMEDRLVNLEHFTGFGATGELGQLLSITKASLAEQLSKLSEQLDKLTNNLESGYVSKKSMETIATDLTGKSEAFHEKIANIYSTLLNNIRDNYSSCENTFSRLIQQLTATANELNMLSKTVEHIQDSVQGNRSSINQLNTKLLMLEQTLPEIKKEISRVKCVTQRVPTGAIVSIRLNDKRGHHFLGYIKVQ